MRRVKFKVVSVDRKGNRNSAFASGKYNLNYPKDSIVRAGEETLGVAVFQTRKRAERFIENCVAISPLQIIRVRPVGRGVIVTLVCDPATEFEISIFYNKEPGLYCSRISPPSGTIFYPAVEVLE